MLLDPYIPDASSGHGWHLCNGTLQPLWTEEEEELTLPDSVINDIIAETDAAENTESNVPDNENDSNDDTDLIMNILILKKMTMTFGRWDVRSHALRTFLYFNALRRMFTSDQ